ncbi:Glutamine synthetase [Limihaloglobus sulfuriphilus]|uniref:Glutamine synthetase n=1 Tax=Limihaloglobus sulfuriphilus TaxID=1851148 RepID=A0A1Q2MI78_9BACT|nr:glutamine synthetase III [Limihaloglobus sulfuriphilus]AQQ72364.1 Glutamine synthetase [Limihaloglobus sulfuriphilus]
MSQTKVSVNELFGINVFNDEAMQERLPKNIYKSFKKTVKECEPLDPALADVIANAMKDWAIEKGATHYCHWFQPMTGFTAEKHDSFIAPTNEGTVIMEFSGKELTQGEPDASSFPSGGLRATFEARGYTAWDCTSPVFIKEDGENTTLYIPCAFCSYTGEALDKKTPLLRSMEALNKHAMRVLRALGNTTSKRVGATLGSEQEYFLIDRKFVEKRIDLVMAGRTLFGSPSPKGQEMDDHYFGSLDERVATYMNRLNIELWKLGVSAKTQHNEVSPAQYEMAPVFSSINLSSDQNQLTMEAMKKVAKRCGFECLLHEKPFAGVNGSGKHNNWSLCTDDGINLLDPGSTPHENMVFLIFLCSVVRAVDKYAKLLRASVASAGNDHRLGANEAPPAIVSVFLGDQLNEIFTTLAKGPATSCKEGGKIKLGVTTLPELPKDTTDRNRTSPFAFTGNKFEFRMVGSSQSVSGPNFVLNTIVAEVLSEIADKLESSDDKIKAAGEFLQKISKENGKIVFNGDNYSQDWVTEAEKRTLPNMRKSVEALNTITEPAFVDVFEKHGVLSKGELKARQEIMLENYATTIAIEAKATINIAKRQILPAVVKYSLNLAQTVNGVTSSGSDASVYKEMLDEISSETKKLKSAITALEKSLTAAEEKECTAESAECFCNGVIPSMDKVRMSADKLETLVDAAQWPLPTYAEMLFLK